MRDTNQTETSALFGTEWTGMAQDVLRNSEFSDNPALERLQAHAHDGNNGIDIGCYSRMHHRHNR